MVPRVHNINFCVSVASAGYQPSPYAVVTSFTLVLWDFMIGLIYCVTGWPNGIVC